MDRLDSQEGSDISDNSDLIRQKFEDCLIEGLKGQPLTTKDGVVRDPSTEEMVLVAPEASFLSVVRAYLKDLTGDAPKDKAPTTGKAQGLLAEFERKSKLPFGQRAN
ncbi:hypothetical protein [Caballeronia sp. LZ032]|uniref:hypothetical protein n=1 Tax=Caballeronia sp. LZ032 TaxID=3038565 RepID=UPI002854DFAB|nr:hypothetical protein [Caballeronia sp. LZ032]MDR5879007.1 hypothetical protein [Caballeronia sp. LZ032]